MANGNGVNIGIAANIQPAVQNISKLQQTLGKLGGIGKNLFGGNSVQQAQQYTRHLQNIERGIERVTMRVKTLQGAQQQLFNQQKQMNAAGVNPLSPQSTQLNRAINQNSRSLSFWQAKQVAMQAQQQAAVQNRPGIGGGGGGVMGFMTGQVNQLASGAGGGLLKMLGIGAITGGISAVVTKAVMLAVDEQKGYADLRTGLRGGRMKGTSAPGFMNNLRDIGMPLGFSGVESLQVAQAMAPGSGDGARIQRDTKSAMQMGRMFGIDAGGEASMLAEGGKMGAFVPGQARKFAEILAREIHKAGMDSRAQEMQEATLSLLHNQVAQSGSASPAAALAMQSVLGRSGMPGLQGAMGASMIQKMQSHFGGAEDDPTVAFTEAMLRDKRGVRGFYNLVRAKERIQQGKDPSFIGDTISESFDLAHNKDQAVYQAAKVLGVPMTFLEDLGKRTKGGLRALTGKQFMAAKAGIGTGGASHLDKFSGQAMTVEGNEIRKIEATIAGTMARGATPLVGGFAVIGAKLADQVIFLHGIADHSKSAADYLHQLVDHFIAKPINHFVPSFPTTAGETQRAAVARKYGPLGPPKIDLETGKPVGPGTTPAVPSAHAIRQLYRNRGQAPPLAPHLNPNWNAGSHSGGVQRSSADIHLYIHHDAHGAIHPHVHHQVMAMVETAMDDVQRRHSRSGLNQRNLRIG